MGDYLAKEERLREDQRSLAAGEAEKGSRSACCVASILVNEETFEFTCSYCGKELENTVTVTVSKETDMVTTIGLAKAKMRGELVKPKQSKDHE